MDLWYRVQSGITLPHMDLLFVRLNPTFARIMIFRVSAHAEPTTRMLMRSSAAHCVYFRGQKGLTVLGAASTQPCQFELSLGSDPRFALFMNLSC